MKSSSLLALIQLSVVSAWTNVVGAPKAALIFRRRIETSPLFMGFDLSGNTWKPDSEKMGSTDTGDFYPEVRIVIACLWSKQCIADTIWFLVRSFSGL